MNKEVLTRNTQRVIPDAQIVETPLKLCPKLTLYLMSVAIIQRHFSEKEIRIILEDTPYWTFCWASGQALAHYILEHKSLMAGKHVLDFGAGSGVGAIAAAMAGAAEVVACDNDRNALDAIAANAALNNVQIERCESLNECSDHIDIIIAADVFYDRKNYRYLTTFLHRAPEILVADSYLKTMDVGAYQKIAEMRTATMPALDGEAESKSVNVFRALAG